jgi:hypothetical protein
MELWAKSYGTFSLEISKCPSILIWSYPMWHYLMCHHYQCYPVFLPWHFRNLKVPIHFNLELSHVALSNVSPLSMLPCFHTLTLSSLQLVIFRHPYLTHQSPSPEIFSTMNSTLYFLHIYCLNYYLKNNFLPSNFEKILWSSKFLKMPPSRSYETLGFESWLYNFPILILRHIVGLCT